MIRGIYSFDLFLKEMRMMCFFRFAYMHRLERMERIVLYMRIYISPYVLQDI